jgi:hypothetical protein
MDAHFHEYLAAVAGMQECYGHPAEDHPTEFHDECVTHETTIEPVAAVTAITTGATVAASL